MLSAIYYSPEIGNDFQSVNAGCADVINSVANLKILKLGLNRLLVAVLALPSSNSFCLEKGART